MGTSVRIAIVLALVAVIGIVVSFKTGASTGAPAGISGGVEGGELPDRMARPAAAALPRMVDLGAGRCLPCKMMEPILESLKHEFAEQFETVFIDVWEDRAAGRAYGIRVIPTQIFYNAEGVEVFRHEGFYSKEDILGKWRELGFDFQTAEVTPGPTGRRM